MLFSWENSLFRLGHLNNSKPLVITTISMAIFNSKPLVITRPGFLIWPLALCLTWKSDQWPDGGVIESRLFEAIILSIWGYPVDVFTQPGYDERISPWKPWPIEIVDLHMGVSENSVPLNPMVNDHYPY